MGEELILSQSVPIELSGYSDGILLAGHAQIPEISWTGSAISTNLNSAADLSDVTWVEGDKLIDLTGPGEISFNYVAHQWFCGCFVDTNEDDSDGVRVQVIIDGVTVFDSYVDGSGNNYAICYGLTSLASGGPPEKIKFNSSFIIRAVCKGTFADSGSEFSIERGHYVLY